MNNLESAQSFQLLLEQLSSQGRVAQMRLYSQHGGVSTYEHAMRVAATALRWSCALRLRVSEPELVRGAVLHDYFLYDWHEPGHRGHAMNHPLRALRNAEADFALTDKERNIIVAHMWPLPPTRVPKSREAWLVCVADKWCTLTETLFVRRFPRHAPFRFADVILRDTQDRSSFGTTCSDLREGGVHVVESEHHLVYGPASAKWKMPDRLPFPGESWDNVGSSFLRGDRPECLWKWSPERLFPRVTHKLCEKEIENADTEQSGGMPENSNLYVPIEEDSKIGV